MLLDNIAFNGGDTIKGVVVLHVKKAFECEGENNLSLLGVWSTNAFFIHVTDLALTIRDSACVSWVEPRVCGDGDDLFSLTKDLLDEKVLYSDSTRACSLLTVTFTTSDHAEHMPRFCTGRV